MYSSPFDEVFVGEGIRTINTSVRAPRTKATAEQFVRTFGSG
jgi:hypothetical protein